MPMAASHQPYYMHMGPAAIPIMDRIGTLISFPSGHYPGTRAFPICSTVLSLSRIDINGNILSKNRHLRQAVSSAKAA